MAAQAQIGVAEQAAAAITGWFRFEQRGAEAQPGGPDHPLDRQWLLDAGGAAGEVQPVGLHRGHPGAGAQANVAAAQGLLGLLAAEGPVVGQQPIPLLDQFHQGAASR